MCIPLIPLWVPLLLSSGLPSTEIVHFLAIQGHPNTLKWLTIGLDPTNNSKGVVTVPLAVTKPLRGSMLNTLQA